MLNIHEHVDCSPRCSLVCNKSSWLRQSDLWIIEELMTLPPYTKAEVSVQGFMRMVAEFHIQFQTDVHLFNAVIFTTWRHLLLSNP